MNRIKKLRQENGWMQADLAQKLKTSRQTVGNYETGERGMDVETICKLCDIFDVTADYLLGRSTIPRYDLPPEELDLLRAYRAADEDAREMVRLALKRWTPEEQEQEGAV